MNSNNRRYLYIVATIFVLTCFGIACTNAGFINQTRPMQLHLSLTDKSDEIKVTWLTKSALPQPTVYYYSVTTSSQCDRESAVIPTDILKRLSIAIGTTTTYEKYDGFIHSVVLTNLRSSKTYCYLVGGEVTKTPPQPTSTETEASGKTDSSNIYASSWAAKWSHFTTRSQFLADKVTFAAFADAGTRGDIFHVINAMRKDPSFSMVIHAGDLSYAQTDDVWDLFGDIIEPVSATRPYMVIPGNWDIKPFAAQAFVNRYQMPLVYPTPEITVEHKPDGPIETKTFYNYYYSINYTHTYIIMMSSYDPYTQGSKQYKWLESELIKANQQRHITPWIVVCAHSPMYSSSQGHGGSDMAFRQSIEPLFSQYKVNLVLSGHDHGYERSFPVYDDKILRDEKIHYSNQDGTIHVLAGTAGADSDPWLDQPAWSLLRESTTGYTKVIAGRGSLEVIYQRYNGTIGDRFIIVKDSSSRPSQPINKSNSGSSNTTYVIFFLLCLVFIFPFCAYNKIPHKIYSYLSGRKPND
ncbi:hypothetical protein CYY_000698 [Polysphondylium violaceum]|uniref:Purple acid phosphatase n=1 Tax=Polysphondylium violaceum TaxID=133409 RepID=A0A8J4Q345_9MYCE|nr:hypothetical protein CYY_000698 [Polysphondylium violaceum]